ncbi:MAG: GspH/FimT family pseudopilin [Gammaproteobacteria bacterium]|jgi:type IV fimbrial biogenesis protein FimT
MSSLDVSHDRYTSCRQQQGLTLPELLVSLTIVSTLTVGAVSQFHNLIQNNRMVAEVNLFVAALHLARNEAVKHGRRVVLCPSRDRVNCGNSSAWSHGWMLFASENREHEADETLLQSGNPLGAGIILHASNYRKRIVYQPDGSSGGSNSTFTFCDARKAARPRVICLSNSGRPRLIYRRCDGGPVSCP